MALLPRQETDEEAAESRRLEAKRFGDAIEISARRDASRYLAGVNGTPEAPPDSTFPISLLQPMVEDMVLENSRSLDIPYDLGAAISLAVIGGCAGKGIHLRYRNYNTRANLFVVLSAESGLGKSETLRRLVEPVLQYQVEMTKQWRKNVEPRAKARRDLAKRKIDQLKAVRGEDENFLLQRAQLETEWLEADTATKNPYTLICEDASEEAFVEHLAQTGGCTLSYSPDAARVLDNLFGRMGGKGTIDDSHYLKAFSGEIITKNRISRDAATVLDPCASILWVTTPDRMTPIWASQTLLKGGFMARVLAAEIHLVDKKISKTVPPAIDPDVQHNYYCLVADILTAYRFHKGEPYTVYCTPEAEQLLIDFYNRNVDSIMSDQEVYGMRELARRWPEMAVRIALGQHLAKYGKRAKEFFLDIHEAFAAISIVEWFIKQQRRTYEEKSRQAFEEKVTKVWELAKLLSRQNSGRVYPKHFYSRNNGGRILCSSSEEANAVLCELVALGYLEGPISGVYPQHKTTYYTIK